MDLNHTYPNTNNQVEETVKGSTLEFLLNDQITHCSDLESIVWALCKANISNLAQIQYQFSTLQEIVTEDNDDLFVLDCINSFAQKGLLELTTKEAITYPVDLSPYPHIMSSRGGLFGINENSFKRLADGMYFGICFDDQNSLIAYEFPHLTTPLWRDPFGTAKKNLESNHGVIRRFSTQKNGSFNMPETLHTEITNNCHHLVYDQGSLVGVDTERQGVFIINESGEKFFLPLFEDESYHHINSLVKTAQHWLLLKSITSPNDLTSSFGVFDHDWNQVNTIDLNAQRAHDFLITTDNNDLSFWYCDSEHDHIRHYPSDNSIHVKPKHKLNNTTRGFSESQEYWVVGNGLYGEYYGNRRREKMLATINYIDKTTGELHAQIDVPEAPCSIIPNPYHQEQQK